MKKFLTGCIADQIRLCEEATLSFKAYEEAKGIYSAAEVEKLRLKAEFHYKAVTDYLLQENQSDHSSYN